MASITNLSGDIVNFSTSLEKPLQNLKIHFNPIQEGSGDPSPDNVRPITGWTGINLYHSGKNLFNLTAESFIIPNSSAYAYAPIPVNFEAEFSFIKKNTNIDTSNISFGVSYYAPTSVSEINKGYTWNIERGVIQTGNKSKNVVTYPSNTDIYLQVAHYAVIYPKTAIADFFSAYDVQLEIASVTSYEPYQGNIIPVDWSDNGTIYGGYIDFANNELVQEWASLEIQWNKYKNNYAMTEINRRSYLFPINRKEIGGQNQMMCNIAIPGHHLRDNVHFYIAPENNYVYMFLPKDIDENTIVQVVAKITEPIHHPLTVQQIKTLKGINNIWSDANDQIDASYSDRSGSMLEYRKNILLNSPHIETLSNSLIPFKTDMIVPLKECIIPFSPIQDGEGSPSNENIRPIHGWSGINLYTCTDILPITYIPSVTTNLGVTWTVLSSGIVTAYGSPTSYAGCHYGDIDVNGDEILYGRIIGTMNNVTFNKPILYDENNNSISFSASDSILSYGLDLSQYQGVKKVRVCLKRSANDIFMRGSARVIVQKNKVPPYPRNIPISWGNEYGDIYGGYIDLLNGELVQEYGEKKFVGDVSENWSFYNTSVIKGTESHIFHTTSLDRIIKSLSGKETLSNIARNYTSSINSVSDRQFLMYYIGVPTKQVIVYINSSFCEPTVESFSDWLSEHNFQLVYKLQDPIHHSFTPQQIKTIRDTNSIWSDSNEWINIKYWNHNDGKRPVVWNQWAPPINEENWKAYNTNYNSISFSNGVVTSEWLVGDKRGYSTSVKTIIGTPQAEGQIWYASYMVNPSQDGLAWGIEFCGGRQHYVISNVAANKWSRCSSIGAYYRGTNNFIYISNTNTVTDLLGLIAQCRAPIHVNLTQMFGAGNEPATAAEFEEICSKNGMDLTQAQPYNEGTTMWWYV